MYQPALAALHPWTDAATAKDLRGPSADDEAHYCLARAAVEARRAEEATHPAARRVHAQMAALYRQRAVGAQKDDGEIYGLLGGDGNLVPEYG